MSDVDPCSLFFYRRLCYAFMGGPSLSSRLRCLRGSLITEASGSSLLRSPASLFPSVAFSEVCVLSSVQAVSSTWVSAAFVLLLMASSLPVVPLASLDDSMHNIRLHVRVVRLWCRPNGSVVNFLLVDKEGGAIQGTMPAKERRRMYGQFAEGRLCELTRFTIVPADTIFQATSHAFALNLNAQTMVRTLPASSVTIPMHYFELKQLEDVGVTFTLSTDIIDVVARIAGFGRVATVQTGSGLARIATLYLANERDMVLEVTLWEEFIDKFDIPALIARSAQAPVVVACNGLQIRKFQDRYSLKSFVGTRFHFDESIPELAAFRARLSSHTPPIFNGSDAAAEAMPGLRPVALPRNTPRRVTLQELCAFRTLAAADLFDCVAQISDVITRFDWWYPSCPACSRKIEDPQKHPYCEHSDCRVYKRKVVAVPWYRFTVRVVDGEAASRFVLLGKYAEAVVGTPAHEVASKPNPTPEQVPPHIMGIIGKRYLFTVAPRQDGPVGRFGSFTVKDVFPVPPDHPPVPMLPAPDAAVHAAVV